MCRSRNQGPDPGIAAALDAANRREAEMREEQRRQNAVLEEQQRAFRETQDRFVSTIEQQNQQAALRDEQERTLRIEEQRLRTQESVASRLSNLVQTGDAPTVTDEEDANLDSRRRGRRSLRIDPVTANTGGTAPSGVNVARG